MVGVSCGLGACTAPTHGVQAFNATDQTVRAEMITVDAAGESSVYATAIVSSGATFVNRMPAPVRGQLMRARFTLADQTLADNNWVMLNLPDRKKSRVFTLRLENGRLVAVEAKRNMLD